MWNEIQRLLKCFGGSFINNKGEFIAVKNINLYVDVSDCKTITDLEYTVLAGLSKVASASSRLSEYRMFVRWGINDFLKTSFSNSDIKTIYHTIGNGINKEKATKLIESRFDMRVLGVSDDKEAIRCDKN